MITRLYADNFKTLVNFELPLGADESASRGQWLREVDGFGDDSADQEFRSREEKTSAALFPTSSLCRWDNRKVQTFEIDLRGKRGNIYL